jgi:hypothetical protein
MAMTSKIGGEPSKFKGWEAEGQTRANLTYRLIAGKNIARGLRAFRG